MRAAVARLAAQQVSAAMAAMVVEKVAAMVEGREVAKGAGAMEEALAEGWEVVMDAAMEVLKEVAVACEGRLQDSPAVAAVLKAMVELAMAVEEVDPMVAGTEAVEREVAMAEVMVVEAMAVETAVALVKGVEAKAVVQCKARRVDRGSLAHNLLQDTTREWSRMQSWRAKGQGCAAYLSSPCRTNMIDIHFLVHHHRIRRR